GQGVPGAFMSMLGVSFLNEIMASKKELEPGEILTRLKDRVVNELGGENPESGTKDGMDAAMVKIPLRKEQGVSQAERSVRSDRAGNKEEEGGNEKGEAGYEEGHPQGEDPNPHRTGSETSHPVRFAGAQNPLYVIQEGITERGIESLNPSGSHLDRIYPFKKEGNGVQIKGDPAPVGYDEHQGGDFTTIDLDLRSGDMLYIFSDGYADQFGGPKGKKFRYGPFKRLLHEVHEQEASEQKRILEERFRNWKEESQQEQVDDVLVIGIRI
ncbi:MAG: PP2C family protein-serine/threonine phosphatase, partial [Flavobacteriales bacterium]